MSALRWEDAACKHCSGAKGAYGWDEQLADIWTVEGSGDVVV